MNKIVIVDLDGTLANVDHRLNLVRRKKKWFDRFYDLCHKDKINEWCKELILGMLSAGHEIKIVSARPQKTFMVTGKWLLDNGIPSTRVTLNLLRKDMDFTPDNELKQKWVNSKAVDKSRVLFVVDDRQRVVDMWRKEGLICLQCYAWPEYETKKA